MKGFMALIDFTNDQNTSRRSYLRLHLHIKYQNMLQG